MISADTGVLPDTARNNCSFAWVNVNVIRYLRKTVTHENWFPSFANLLVYLRANSLLGTCRFGVSSGSGVLSNVRFLSGFSFFFIFGARCGFYCAGIVFYVNVPIYRLPRQFYALNADECSIKYGERKFNVPNSTPHSNAYFHTPKSIELYIRTMNKNHQIPLLSVSYLS